MADLILPLDPSQRYFGGYVEAMGRQYRVSMACPQGRRGMVDLASFRCDPELSALLEARGVWDTLRARLAQTEDVEGFMAELADVLEKVLRSCPKQDPPPAEFYSRLVSEIDAVGWSHLVSMDSLLTSVQLRERDAAGREHVFAVSLPSNYPHSPPICSVDLPTHLNLRWSPGQSSLATVLEQFREALTPFHELWNVLDDLDEHTWVLEPEKPSRSTTHRRVAVARHCSVMLKIDPRAPGDVPEVRFLGSQAVIGPLREAYERNLFRWNHSLLVRANLEAALELTLPSPATTAKADYSADCGICYAYRLQQDDAAGDGGKERDYTTAGAAAAAAAGAAGGGSTRGRGGVDDSGGRGAAAEDAGAIPDRVCDNAKCRRPYHPKCLFVWLQGLPTSRVSFDTIFGQCPYCSDPISVKFAQG
ncbi:unnamed protein product [Ectocarpus sp. 12 AP-2014]